MLLSAYQNMILTVIPDICAPHGPSPMRGLFLLDTLVTNLNSSPAFPPSAFPSKLARRFLRCWEPVCVYFSPTLWEMIGCYSPPLELFFFLKRRSASTSPDNQVARFTDRHRHRNCEGWTPNPSALGRC